jgi:hypothetical protein
MVRYMYDSTVPTDIPTFVQMVAGYIDGDYGRWDESDWNRWPDTAKVRIARRTYTDDGDVLDVEYGIPTVWPLTDASVREGIVNWVRRRRTAGKHPAIYCNELNDWAPVRDIFIRAGVAQPLYWVARYNGVAQIPAGAIARQYANPPLTGEHYDLSVVADYWPGVDNGDDMSWDQEFSITRADTGASYKVSAGEMLKNLYTMTFFGSTSAPWNGPSVVAHLKELSAQSAIVDVDALADALIARAPLGASRDDIIHIINSSTLNVSRPDQPE